jgi:hypothetical protein
VEEVESFIPQSHLECQRNAEILKGKEEEKEEENKKG